MDRPHTQFRPEISFKREPQGFFGKILAFLLSAALLAAGLMFSLVAVAAVAVIGLGLGGWLWWKTRTLRQQMRQMQQERQSTVGSPSSTTSGRQVDVIEGECVRETDPGSRASRLS